MKRVPFLEKAYQTGPDSFGCKSIYLDLRRIDDLTAYYDMPEPGDLPVCCLVGDVPKIQPDAAATAGPAAIAWLALVDAEKYGDSWDQAAPYFRNALERNRWIQSLDAVRKPLGSIKARNMRQATHHSELPGAPDGEYVLFIYDTTFAHKKSAMETLTIMKTDSGEWKAAGYYIR
jgi:hypothetical protein